MFMRREGRKEEGGGVAGAHHIPQTSSEVVRERDRMSEPCGGRGGTAPSNGGSF